MKPPEMFENKATKGLREEQWSVYNEVSDVIDTPLYSEMVGDQPSWRDELGFNEYVRALEQFVTDEGTQPPLVVSVEGAWGAGKSSFMLQLAQQLGHQSSVVWFNPWRHDDATNVWAAFVLTLIKNVRPSSWHERVFGHTRLFFWRLDLDALKRTLAWKGLVGLFLLSALLAGGAALMTVSGFSAPALDASTALQLGLAAVGVGGATALRWGWTTINRTESNIRAYMAEPDYADRVTLIEDIRADIVHVLNAYVGKNRVFVFIDDLDRCTVPRAADLMQAINLLFCDDPRLVYFIGMDQKKVAAGIAAKHEPLLEMLDEDADGIAFGLSYLDKFVQVPFYLPRPGKEEVEDYIESLVNRASASRTLGDPDVEDGDASTETVSGWTPPVLQETTLLIADVLEHNPRRLKKFINLFRLRAFLANRMNVVDDITLPQLGKTVAITLRWPQLLDDVQADRLLLRDLHRIAIEGTVSESGGSPDDGRDAGTGGDRENGSSNESRTNGDTEQGEINVNARRRSQWQQDWTSNEPLLALLRALPAGDPDDWEYPNAIGPREDVRNLYFLEDVDITELLEISPTFDPTGVRTTVADARRMLGKFRNALEQGIIDRDRWDRQLDRATERCWSVGAMEAAWTLDRAQALLREGSPLDDRVIERIDALISEFDAVGREPAGTAGEYERLY